MEWWHLRLKVYRKQFKVSESDKHYKLFVKNICMVCLNKAMSCHYCNGVGNVYVEVSDKGVGRWISGLDEERKQTVLDYIKGIDSGNN